jgi:hypothetical protein
MKLQTINAIIATFFFALAVEAVPAANSGLAKRFNCKNIKAEWKSLDCKDCNGGVGCTEACDQLQNESVR